MTPLGQQEKGWGFEIIWANNEKYSGKILVFAQAGSKTSMLFHKDKSKSWFVNAGRFRFKFCDVKTGEYKETILEEGQTANVDPLSPHQLEALVPGSMIFEVGTCDADTDRYRIMPGDTQTKQSGQ